jgi:hypothetical protein
LVDSVATADPFTRVYERYGCGFLRPKKTHSAQAATSDARTLSRDWKLDGRRDPLASQAESEDFGRRTFPGFSSETLSIDSWTNQGSTATDGRKLGIPIHLVIFSSLGSRRPLSSVRNEIGSGKDRGPYYLLVSHVPSQKKDLDLKS